MSDLPIYGIDIELKSKIESKVDSSTESQVLDMFQRYSNQNKDPSISLHQWLKNGVVLCRFAQSIRPDLLGNFKEDAQKPFQMMENIEAFHRWCSGMGLLHDALFQTVELYEAKNIPNVMISLLVLRDLLVKIERKETPAPPLKFQPAKKSKDYKPILWNSWLPPKQEQQWDHLNQKNETVIGESPKSPRSQAEQQIKKPAPVFSGILEKRKSSSQILRSSGGSDQQNNNNNTSTDSENNNTTTDQNSSESTPVGVDPAFMGAGEKQGLLIWRAENMKIVPIPEQDYGKFYVGDSYIILNTKKVGSQMDIHFWLGSESSTDEMGLVAYKAFELDEHLGGSPVQYREVQEHESPQFMSLFKATGIQYLKGGVESGFKHVDRDSFEARLLHLKGSRNVRVSQVPISVESLNDGDVFILDLGRKIFQWNGSKSSRREKIKGMEIARRIKDDERGSNAEFFLLDPTEGSTEKPDETEFWETLGGTKDQVKSEEEGGSDELVEKAESFGGASVLYQVSDASGELEVNEVGRSPLNSEWLDDDDCFLLDAGSEVWVWIGKKATKQERLESMNLCQEFLAVTNKPKWTPVMRVVSGAETTLFKSKFRTWKDKSKLKEQQQQKSKTFSFVRTKSALQSAREGSSSDLMSVLKSPRKGDESDKKDGREKELEDTEGELKLWRIENFELVEHEVNGQFFSGDSYILLYSYGSKQPNGQYLKHLIYIWQGSHSSQDERGSSVLHARNIQDDLPGTSSQVRVTQNKEPDHFLKLFKGKMVIHEGGVDSGFKNRQPTDSKPEPKTRLYHVRGTTEHNTRAVEVAAVTSSLNSNDVFIVLEETEIFIWMGKGANLYERKCSMNVANILKGERELKPVEEGKEPSNFFDKLGGPDEYASEGWLAEQEREPRLFQCSNASGKFNVEEIFNYSQEDLDVSDIFILDCYNEVFVWVGYDSNEIEKALSFELAVKFVDGSDDGRSKDTPITMVISGEEPVIFTCHFLGWDHSLFVRSERSEKKNRELFESISYSDVVEETMGTPETESEQTEQSKDTPSEQQQQLVEVKNTPPQLKKQSNSRIDVRQAMKAFSDNQVVPYSKLITRPPGCDPTLLETYLSDEEFVTVFGMGRDQFDALPNWKKVAKKREKNLF